MLHPQAERAAALWRQAPPPGDSSFDLPARREQGLRDAAGDLREHVDAVVDVDADGVSCRLFRPRRHAPLLIGLHGGGFVLGEIETHDAHWRRLANRTGWAVLAVDYRRAPEHRYPAACDDVDRALAWARSHGPELAVDAATLAVAGDSAGGQLALVAALRNRSLTAAVLVYPCLDPTGSQPSYGEETGGLTAAEMDWYWRSYLGPEAVIEGELDLLHADLSELPPTLVITAEHDPLRDEGELLVARLSSSGVPASGVRYLGMIHGFWRWPDLFDASELAVRQVAAFLQGVLDDPAAVDE